ncbi:hypothetical protein [Roseateles sp. BYS96W]|uniref:Baseplate protein J-like domain-containing protein n=1 Tax=Pelomonas nitida TaxID=3299027 RepID=A0ABW7G4M4_9BURK
MSASPDASQRRARMLDLLPRIYAAQSPDSAIGTLVEAMAQRLAVFDQDLQRVLHDRWVALACGVPDARDGDAAAALDRLGALLQIARLPAAVRHAGAQTLADGRVAVTFVSQAQRDEALLLLELRADGDGPALPRIAGLAVDIEGPTQLVFRSETGDTADPDDAGDPQQGPLARLQELLSPEPTDAYRQRLQITMAVTSAGLATPRAVLSLAIADLGAAPCPKFQRRADATLARGVAQRAQRRCQACGNPALPCPQATLFDAWISEQPAHPVDWQDNDAQLQRVLTLRNDSLVGDRPELTMEVDRPVSFPALQSRASGEIVLYADDLLPGHTLRLLPQLDPQEVAATQSYDRPVSHQWLLRSPHGRAELVDKASGRVRDVSASVFYLRGSQFDDAASRLGGVNVEGLRCGVLEQAVRTPRLEPGDNDWVLLTFTAPAYRFDAPTTTFAQGPNDPGAHFALLDAGIGDGGADFATQLFQWLKRTDDQVADPATLPHFKLAAHWVARPAFLFNLRIPKNGWVQAAELRGAVDLLRADIERARPAGVSARVDFPEPIYREQQPQQQAFTGFDARLVWREDAAPDDAHAPQLALRQALTEAHPLAEGRLTLGAIIDTTRFDWSTLQ